jgi:hypothetical protein
MRTAAPLGEAHDRPRDRQGEATLLVEAVAARARLGREPRRALPVRRPPASPVTTTTLQPEEARELAAAIGEIVRNRRGYTG